MGMNKRKDQFLACARLPAQQYGHVFLANPRRRVQQFSHYFRAADEGMAECVLDSQPTVTDSVDSFDCFNTFKLDVFDFSRSAAEI